MYYLYGTFVLHSNSISLYHYNINYIVFCIPSLTSGLTVPANINCCSSCGTRVDWIMLVVDVPSFLLAWGCAWDVPLVYSHLLVQMPLEQCHCLSIRREPEPGSICFITNVPNIETSTTRNQSHPLRNNNTISYVSLSCSHLICSSWLNFPSSIAWLM